MFNRVDSITIFILKDGESYFSYATPFIPDPMAVVAHFKAQGKDLALRQKEAKVDEDITDQLETYGHAVPYPATQMVQFDGRSYRTRFSKEFIREVMEFVTSRKGD